MQDRQRFERIHLALLALNWQALERIDELLPAAGDPWATPQREGRLQWLRLELLQLQESTERCARARHLSIEQRQQVQMLVRTLLDWLDFEAAMPIDLVRLRLAAAQNWLLDEAGRYGQRAEDSTLSRRRG